VTLCTLFAAPVYAQSTPAPTADRKPAQAGREDAACATPPKALQPPGAWIVAGGREHYTPILESTQPNCSRFGVSLAGHLTAETVSAYPVDRDANRFAAGTTLRPRLRLGAYYDSGKAFLPLNLHVEYEHDLYTGILGDETELAGSYYPSHQSGEQQLRKAFIRASIGYYLHASVGWTTSHWGLGLLANDGAHGWEPGSGRFSDPIGGDRTLRAMLATGPHSSAGVMLAVGADILDEDLMSGDDVLLEGDTARQGVAALTVGEGKPHGAGVYVALRQQEALDGDETNVVATDLYLRTKHQLGRAEFQAQSEVAYITGTTDLGPSSDFEQHDVRQLGAAFRAELDAGQFGSALDVLYASGDADLDNAQQNAFRADPNYEVGLLLYRQVLAAQSARGSATAADLTLVGVPAEDLDRVPTRGSATNTLAVFPRLRMRPTAGLEVYAGTVFAFAAQKPADPFNSRVVGGGSPRNALGAMSSRMLGTEYDFGVRFRMNMAGVETTLGGEAGVFTPGPAFTKADGVNMGAIGGARLLLDARM